MKHLLIFIILLSAFTTQAQLVLEKSYQVIGTVTVHNLEGEGHKYMAVSPASEDILLYNTNHTVWKIMDAMIPNNSVLVSASYPSTKLFDNDSYVEVLVTFADTSGGTYKPYIQIVHENGSNYNILPAYGGYVAKVDNSWKLIVNINQNPSYSEVYTLPGNYLNVKQTTGDGVEEASSLLYPNPMNEAATLAYTLPHGEQSGIINVYCSNGVMVRSYKVTNQFKDISVQRNELPAGVYFYSLTTASATGKAEMFVIR